MDTWEINGHTLEFYSEDHQYICDGHLIPSVTQLLSYRFGKKYDGISSSTLSEAARKGTETHSAIERLCKTGEMTDLPEVKNFLFLKKMFKFEVVDNEVPVILFHAQKPICAGRLDMVIERNGELGLADIKRTSVLDRDYLFYQLNIYKIAYEQCYWKDIEFLAGLHLKENKRKFAPIPIDGQMAWELVAEYMEEK